MSKRGLEASFAWIFAIVVGAFIIFLAIYTTRNFISQGQQQTDTEVAAQLVALLSPVETTIESGKYSALEFNSETRVLNKCNSVGTFGEQTIGTQVKSGFGSGWSQEGIPIEFHNKYVFSGAREEGTKLYLFTKPLYLPYKVADLIIATTQNYCFVNAPREIEEEITDLGLPNVEFSSKEQCSRESVAVCFGTSGCEVSVDTSRKSVTHSGKTSYYGEDDGFLYAAIFSDPAIYECQVKRLMKRTAELAGVYATKSELLQGKGCSTNLASELRSYANFTASITSSGSLGGVQNEAQQLGEANNALACRLF